MTLGYTGVDTGFKKAGGALWVIVYIYIFTYIYMYIYIYTYICMYVYKVYKGLVKNKVDYSYEKLNNFLCFSFVADPCDGSCHYNPSGLFADPDHSNQFIQCGCAFRGNVPCTCCQKFFLPCAPDSYFDDHKKVCVHKQHWEALHPTWLGIDHIHHAFNVELCV